MKKKLAVLGLGSKGVAPAVHSSEGTEEKEVNFTRNEDKTTS